MNYVPISIISKIDNDMEAWTFYIEEKDLVLIMEKYGSCGCSVRGNVDDIVYEITDTWK